MRHQSLKYIIFVTLTENSSVITNDTLEIYTPSEIAVGTHFHVQYGTETTSVFLPADGEASWSLLAGSVSLLSGGLVQPENTYSCILKMIGQV